MASASLTSGQCKLVSKWYRKFVNVIELQREWRSEFKTELLALLKSLKIRNKIETVNVTEDVYKQQLIAEWRNFWGGATVVHMITRDVQNFRLSLTSNVSEIVVCKCLA
jgi:hypothetical protein